MSELYDPILKALGMLTALTSKDRTDRELEYVVRANVERKRLRELERLVGALFDAIDSESGQANALYELRRKYRNK